MKKVYWSLAAILLTGMLMLIFVSESDEAPAEARIVTVQRGDVHQVVAIAGRLAYKDEEYICSPITGNVSQVCVEAGQRLGAGEALIRLDSALQEEVVSAYVARAGVIDEFAETSFIEQQLAAEASVIRADGACTVRQVYVSENTAVTAGTPIARVSSNWQEIVCNAAPVDASRIHPGMWAWLSSDNQQLGFAEVVSIGEERADTLTGLTCMEVILQPEKHIDLPENASVDVDVYLAGSDDVASIPVEAITERGTVWWVNEGRCTEIPAEIVMADEMLAWVNLPEGIKVAIGEFVEGQRIVEADQ